MSGSAVLSRRPAADEGFTLIELLLTVVLLGVVGSAIASSLFVMLSSQKRTTASLASSRDQQFLATYFTDDASAALTVATGTQLACGTSVPAIVVFKGKDYDPGATTEVETTVAWSYSAATKQIIRTSCRAASPADSRAVGRDVPTAPSLSASCSTTVAVVNGSAPAEISLRVPSASGTIAALCGRRRSA